MIHKILFCMFNAQQRMLSHGTSMAAMVDEDALHGLWWIGSKKWWELLPTCFYHQYLALSSLYLTSPNYSSSWAMLIVYQQYCYWHSSSLCHPIISPSLHHPNHHHEYPVQWHHCNCPTSPAFWTPLNCWHHCSHQKLVGHCWIGIWSILLIIVFIAATLIVHGWQQLSQIGHNKLSLLVGYVFSGQMVSSAPAGYCQQWQNQVDQIMGV